MFLIERVSLYQINRNIVIINSASSYSESLLCIPECKNILFGMKQQKTMKK